MPIHPELCPQGDLVSILEQSREDLKALRGARIFLTGGTGFIGKWLIATIAFANERLDIKADLVVLSRNPDRFCEEHPMVTECPRLHFEAGDIRSFGFPSGEFSHFIHGATAASAKLNDENPLLMIDTIVRGTLNLLKFASLSPGATVLSLSSGGVYGRQPDDVLSISETYLGAPDSCDPWSAYGEGKRLAELYGTLISTSGGFEHKIARIFAQVGPWLPLDAHYAIGNFIGDALAGGPIRIGGDGQTLRSYLYSTDLIVWLLRILIKGRSNYPYNVGSDQAVSILTLAERVRFVAGGSFEIQVARASMPGQRGSAYIPCVDRARTELRLGATVGLDDGIRKTLVWNRERLSK